MRYRHIIFDLDGTLLDTAGAILPALRDTLLELTGESPPEGELTFALGITGADALERLGIADAAGALDRWNGHISLRRDGIRLFQGVEEALKALAERGFRAGIVTSETREEFAGIFAPFGLEGYFQTVVCADDTRAHKPDPEPLLKYLALTGAGPEEALYVGDSVYDSRCAQAAGIDFALALWGTHDRSIPAKYRLETPVLLTEL